MCSRPSAASDRASLYQAASDAFAADVPREESEQRQHPRSWSGENINLWAKHYRALAALARIPKTRAEARAHLADALTALEDAGPGTEGTYQLHMVLRALGVLVGLVEASALDEIVEKIDLARRIFGEADWHHDLKRFLADSASTLFELETEPGNALGSGRVAQLKETLSKLGVLEPEVLEGVVPLIDSHALGVLRGPDRTYVHRMLEAVTDEADLQRIFLRLLQAELPLYAQIRQGPLEYGKDVVALVEESGRRVLRMYQLKIGTIDMRLWREVKQQLEEIFTVPLETIHIVGEVDSREGFLVCNGHAGPHVDPAMRGWFEQERRDHGHHYEFLHLDSIGRWVIERRLFNTFRAALREVGTIP